MKSRTLGVLRRLIALIAVGAGFIGLTRLLAGIYWYYLLQDEDLHQCVFQKGTISELDSVLYDTPYPNNPNAPCAYIARSHWWNLHPFGWDDTVLVYLVSLITIFVAVLLLLTITVGD